MSYRLYHFPGGQAARLAERLQECRRTTLDEKAEPGAVTAPAVLLVDAQVVQLVRALALKGADPAIAIAVLGEAASLPLTPSEHVYAYLLSTLPMAILAQTLHNAAVHAQLHLEHEQTKANVERLATEFSRLNAIGIALSSERDPTALLGLVLARAREITHADAGSLYLVEEDAAGRRRLRFTVVQNDSIEAPFEGGTLAIGPTSVAGHVAATAQPLNLPDAYMPPAGSAFLVDPVYDTKTGYRSKSMLVVPLTTPAARVIGVLQLINCKTDPAIRFTSREHIEREARPFPARFEELATSVASQAAVAIENARLYAELQAALGQLAASQRGVVRAERLRALGDMAGGLSHDFNNTLAAILGRAQLLLAQVEDQDVRRQLEVVEEAALEAARTLRRVQEFVRMRRERPFFTVELGALAEEVVGATRPRWKDEAEARGLAYDVRVDATPALPVAGDPLELREVLTAVVLNALDAMPAGGRLTLTTVPEGDRVRCTVTDTGVGMTDEVRERVFEPFFTTKGARGSGLGLSVAYGILMRHGGDVDVDSRPGEGTVVTIRLPVATPDTAEPGAEETAPPRGEPLAGTHALVVDDEEAVRHVLEDALTALGCHVTACGDGTTAIARLDAEPFDVVVTDLGMPGASGWDVARHVRRARPAARIVLVTGWGAQLSAADLAAGGIDQLVLKPFEIDQIETAVRKALAGR
ncbi:MAG: ATP-binding protein [Candidatus Rokuibacteriota bacterium]